MRQVWDAYFVAGFEDCDGIEHEADGSAGDGAGDEVAG